MKIEDGGSKFRRESSGGRVLAGEDIFIQGFVKIMTILTSRKIQQGAAHCTLLPLLFCRQRSSSPIAAHHAAGRRPPTAHRSSTAKRRRRTATSTMTGSGDEPSTSVFEITTTAEHYGTFTYNLLHGHGVEFTEVQPATARI